MFMGFIMNVGVQKGRINRGMSWMAPIFWCLTISNLILLNLNTYFNVGFIANMAVVVASIFGGVIWLWTVGYFDGKKKVLRDEQIYFQREMLEAILPDIIKKLKEEEEEAI